MGLFSALLGNAGAVRRQELQKLNKSVNVYDVQKILAHHVLQGLRIFNPHHLCFWFLFYFSKANYVVSCKPEIYIIVNPSD